MAGPQGRSRKARWVAVHAFILSSCVVTRQLVAGGVLIVVGISAMSKHRNSGAEMRTWDQVKWWLLFGLIAWVLLVAAFLIDHSRGYSWPMISERIWRTVGEIVLLKWVDKYQTLIAGVFAVSGGIFVIKATQDQIEEARRIRRIERQKEWKETLQHSKRTLSLISVEFLVISRYLWRDNLNWHDNEYSFISNNAKELVQFDPSILEVARKAQFLLMSDVSDIKQYRNIGINTSSESKYSSVVAFAAHEIFRQAAKKLDQYNEKDWLRKMDSSLVTDQLKSVNQTSRHIRDLEHYFIW